MKALHTVSFGSESVSVFFSRNFIRCVAQKHLLDALHIFFNLLDQGWERLGNHTDLQRCKSSGTVSFFGQKRGNP
jgi:hypothetical protein